MRGGSNRGVRGSCLQAHLSPHATAACFTNRSRERLTEKARFAAWVKLQLPALLCLSSEWFSRGGGKETEHGAKVDSKLTEKRKAARLDEVLTLPSSRQEEEEDL